MRNIARASGQTAGILETFYFTAAENLPDVLPTDGASIVGDLQLKPGSLFYSFEATSFTPEFDQPDDRDQHGDSYTHNFAGFCAGDSPELATAMLELKGQRLVLLYKNHDGQTKLIGDKEHYLKFEYKFNPGTKPGERKGYKFSFKGKSRNPALFFTGTAEVSESAPITPPTQPDQVRLEDTHGNLITTIPAGRTLVIRSGFKLVYRII
jgi:hypothetical protein